MIGHGPSDRSHLGAGIVPDENSRLLEPNPTIVAHLGSGCCVITYITNSLQPEFCGGHYGYSVST